EFSQVFIIGLDEYYLPHSRSRDDPESMAEERRLFYVGLTRAKNRLYLLRACRRRSPYGNYETMQPSRFLESLPAALIRGNFSKGWDQTETYDMWSYQWDRTYAPNHHQPEKKPTGALTQRFFPDMRVEHPVYGFGVVRNSRLEYGDETVEVYFEGVGLKALVASLSNLEILEE
ncbi:MAG: 3'-5' exonuclease, partial [Anaerolineales bacterium]